MGYLLRDATGGARGDIVQAIISIVRQVAAGLPPEQPNSLDDGLPGGGPADRAGAVCGVFLTNVLIFAFPLSIERHRSKLVPTCRRNWARITPPTYPASMYPLGRGFPCPNLKTITKHGRRESTGSEERARI
jgi:hypothetical protein